ncbi:glycosyltransferase family 2 protein [Microbacterium sp.]|uniref:glycosyltransferase family 2 protein n=1 Tax=Microbacterium sp. TaxID=51671 RepID=UPI00273374DD|nr:glycosyltransferase family 2 protein [Microbacterium sp.]MDP3949873.1 glycosyltransferase family 2 protein [Microbacterium sp.]
MSIVKDANAHNSVSVVIPTFNRSRLLMRALDSVAAQTWPGHLECVVVDNASSDDTQRSLGEWSDSNPEIRLVARRWPVNVGPLENWSRGVDLASGDWIKILWSDDWLEPEAVGRLVREAARSDAGTVTCAAIHHSADGRATDMYANSGGPVTPRDVISSVVESTAHLPVSPTAGLIRRDCAQEALHLARVLGTCGQRVIGVDLMMLYFDVFAGGAAVHLDEPLVHFWGGEVGDEDPSITQTSRLGELRTCYDAALYQLIRRFDVAVDPDLWALLRQRSAESRLTRQHSADLLAPPAVMWRRPGSLFGHLRGQISKARAARRRR